MSARDSQRLKQLKTRLAKLDVKCDALSAESKAANNAFSKAVNQAKKLREDIQAMAAREPIVSEHAILRYAERAMGLDSDEVQNMILSVGLIKTIKALGNGTYPIGNNRKAVVKDGVVVSVL